MDVFGCHHSVHREAAPLRFTAGPDAGMRARNDPRAAAGFLTGDTEGMVEHLSRQRGPWRTGLHGVGSISSFVGGCAKFGVSAVRVMGVSTAGVTGRASRWCPGQESSTRRDRA